MATPMAARVLTATEHWTRVELGEKYFFNITLLNNSKRVWESVHESINVRVCVERHPVHGRASSAVPGWCWQPLVTQCDSRMHATQNAIASGFFKPKPPGSGGAVTKQTALSAMGFAPAPKATETVPPPPVALPAIPPLPGPLRFTRVDEPPVENAPLLELGLTPALLTAISAGVRVVPCPGYVLPVDDPFHDNYPMHRHGHETLAWSLPDYQGRVRAQGTPQVQGCSLLVICADIFSPPEPCPACAALADNRALAKIVSLAQRDDLVSTTLKDVYLTRRQLQVHPPHPHTCTPPHPPTTPPSRPAPAVGLTSPLCRLLSPRVIRPTVWHL